jgi:RNA polymerase sigma-70 factor (ECF subfamily)
VSGFESFYRKYQDKLFAYLMRKTGDYFLASDLLQESFARYLKHYGEREQNAALLYTIARNLTIDALRKEARAPHLPLEGNHPQEGDAERYFMVRDEYRKVLKAFQQLDVDERDILALVVSQDLLYREIAEVVGISEANVKVKIHRARVKLRNIIRKGLR